MRKMKLVLIALAIILLNGRSFAQNYAEVLQKSMFFYEAQRSGVLPADNRVSWRANSCVNDGSDVGKDLSGGWFDAGDHMKFNFPMAYSVTTLCWGALEFPDGYAKSSQLSYLKSNIKFATDYLLKCHTAPHELYGQVADGTDHNYWVPAEVVELSYARKSFKITEAAPGSDLAGETAAAMAAASILFKTSDPTYSATLLTHAKQLYEFADNFRGKYSDVITAVNPFYTSWSGYQDELCWGALWLYQATNDVAYLNKAKAEYEKLSNENQTTVKSFGWTLAWDDKSYGCYVLMAKLVGDQQYKDDTERYLNQWFTTRPSTTGPTFTGTGFPILSQWGTFRYAANTSFLMLTYAKTLTDASKKAKYHDRAKWIIDYLLGNNPQKTSYVIGYGSKYPLYPHHRTAHASWDRNENHPAETRHILYGALVGGHKTNSDVDWTDDRHDYYWNEVATDYNACFTGCIAALTDEFGGTTVAGFPQKETSSGEFLNEAKLNSVGTNFTEYSVWSNNRSAWPARVPQLSFGIFVTLTEGMTKGFTVSDYKISTNNSYVTVSGLQLLDAAKDIYYVDVKFNSTVVIFPGGQGECRKEAQIRIGLPDTSPAGSWDPTNDWSYTGVTSTLAEAENIPVYANGILVGGKEPAPIVTYTITASSATGGSISPTGAVIVSKGSNQTFAITPSSGYKVSAVTVEGASVGAVASYTFTNVTAAHTIAASFVTAPSYTITASAGTGGTITPNGPVSVTENANQSFSISALAGYKISNVTVDGVAKGAISSYTFSSVVANHTITASFVAVPTYTITASAATGGSITPAGAVIVSEAANQSFAIAAGAGYKISNVAVDGVLQGAISSYTFTNVTANHTIAATFEVSTCDLLSLFEAPSVSALPSLNTVYKYVHVLGSHSAITNISTFTINWDLANKGLYQFSINTTNGVPNWFADLRTSMTFKFDAAGATAKLTGTGANIDGDYYVVTKDANLVLVDKAAAYAIVFSNVATPPAGCGDVTNYTITASAGTGGSISPSGAVSVASGSNKTFAIAASAGYTINEVLVDGVTKGAITTYSFSNVIANHTIAASFSPIAINYTITATAGTGGTITPSGAVSVASGSNKSFAIAASAGYKISTVTVDGVSQGAIASYPFANVVANHTIDASFVIDNNPCDLLSKYSVPRSTALPTMANISYTHSYTLGTGGPNLSNVTNFTINWDLANKGLYQFSMNTSNGVPGWWVDLLPKISQTFSVSSPACKLTATGITGLDGNYWANMDGSNLVLVAKSGAYALYFTNGTAPSGCAVMSAKVETSVEFSQVNAISMFPNPLDKNGILSLNLREAANGANYTILDLSGKIILAGALKSAENNVSVSGKLNNGIYFVKISNGNEQLIQKLIVQ